MIWNTSLSEAEKRQMAAYKYSSNFETALTNSILILSRKKKKKKPIPNVKSLLRQLIPLRNPNAPVQPSAYNFASSFNVTDSQWLKR